MDRLKLTGGDTGRRPLMKGTEGAVSSVIIKIKFMLLETYRKSNGYGGDDNSAVIIAQFIRHIE